MEFITSGDRIATENFSIGKIYTVTFTNGNYFINTCVGIGPDFVMFQQEAPKMLFCLDMESAETVSSIDESGGGSGTTNYNELNNKPSINGVTLVGNKTAADLSILPVPIVGENDNNKILTASYSGGVGSYSWQPAPSSGTSDYTQLTNKPQINSVELNGNKSLSDLGIASAEALAGKQDIISDLSTIRSGAAAGATAVQPATLDGYQPLINDLSTIRSGAAAGATAVQPATLAGYQPLIDSSHKLDPTLIATDTNNRFATDTQLNQIATNTTNILTLINTGAKNILKYDLTGLKNANTAQYGYTWVDNACSKNGVTFTLNNDNSVTITGTATATTQLSFPALTINAGDYIITEPSSTLNYYLFASAQISTENGNCPLTVSTPTNYNFKYGVISGTDMGAGVTVYPMICTSAQYAASNAYEPYCPTLAELYAMVKDLHA